MCCKRVDEENIIESNDFSSNFKKNNYNILEQITQLKNYNSNYNTNTEYTDKNYDLEKVKKIQENYRLYQIRNKFINKVKPSIEKKTTNYINKFYKQCELGGEITSNEEDDFSLDGWKRYYPPDERFFLYSKGEVFPNQIRLKNVDDPDKIEIYEGEMNYENMKHGNGVLTTPHYILKGTWRKGEFTGWGRKTMRNGDILEGKFVCGEINGKGIFKNKDNKYIGEFINGERCGKGDLTTAKYHYKGDFKDNKFNGFGVIEFLLDGQKYEGSFENNEINGKGIYTWKNGDIYEGEMKNGKMNGNGKYTYKEDKKIYEGEYVNGVKEGKGKLYYPDGKIYEGNFKEGLPDGSGFYTKNGVKYNVLFSQGQFVKIIS